MYEFEWTNEFEIESLGVYEVDVYDIEVEDNHNFFANDILVHNSNYFNFGEVKEKYAPEMDFMDFAEIMEKEVLDPFIVKIFDIFAEKKNTVSHLEFKREGLITKQFVLAKKKYITELRANEDKVYDPPLIKATGVETVRSSTPAYNRTKIMSVIQYIFDTLDKSKILKLLRQIKKEFKQQDIGDISSITGIKEYTKYATKPTSYYVKNGLTFPKGATGHAKASMCYNYMIKKHSYPYMEIANGTKLKYVCVNNKNVLKSEVMAYVGNWPSEFDKHFEIDYDTQYQKTFLSVINRMFLVLGWGELDLKENKMSNFMR